MNQAMIKFLSKYTGISEDKLKSEILNDNGDDSLLSKFFEGKELWGLDKVKEVIVNAKKEGVDELTKPNAEIPEGIYNAVKKIALDKIESNLVKKYEVEDFSGTDDLISKIIEKRSKKSDDNELVKENELLKNKLQSEIDSKSTIIDAEKKKRLDYIANTALDAEINELPINAEGEALSISRQIARSMFLAEHNISVTEDEDGKPTFSILSKNGEVMKDEVLNPVKLSDALTSFASKGYVSLKKPDGRGGKSSSPGDDSNPYKGMPSNELAGYVQKQGFAPMSAESKEAVKSWEQANNKEYL